MIESTAICPNCKTVILLPAILTANQGAVLIGGARYTVECPQCGERYEFEVRVVHLVKGGEK